MHDRTPWTFLTNHAHALICIARDPNIRIRDLADNIGVTERAAAKIVSDLDEAKYIEVQKIGRRNRYAINRKRPLRHPLESNHNVGQMIDILGSGRLFT